MPEIRARAVVTPAGLHGPTVIEVDDAGLITRLVAATAAETPDHVVCPGFVDLQVNGVDDVDIAVAAGNDWQRLDDLLLAQGTTSWLPTLITAPLDSYAAPLARIASAMARRPAAHPTIIGVHLEGPFLGGAPGAHPTRHIIPVDLGFVDALPDHVRLVTVAPEQELAIAAIKRLVARGISVSLGHSTASEAESLAAHQAGAAMATHLFNGMGPLHHRSPGLAAVAMTEPAMMVALIADGVHVHERMLRLAMQAVGAARTILVTDAVAWRAGSAGEVRLALGADGAPHLADGTLAGSALTMDAAVRRLVDRCGASLVDAVAAAATNPARLIGLDDRGAIEVGRRADLVALTDSLQVAGTWIAGLRAS